MQLDSTQQLIRDAARAFAAQKIAPYVHAWESAGTAPRTLYRDMAKSGLMSVCVDPAFGGAGADFVAYALAIEEIAAVDGGISNVMAATNSPVAAAISQHGSDWQKNEYLPGICDGRYLGSIHLTEPHTGSDASAIRTRARRERDGWVINGHKAFITAGQSSDIAMIVAVTNADAGKRGISTFITRTDNPGYRVLRVEDKLGYRTCDTCQVTFDNMWVPDRDLLGQEGRGLGIALANLSVGRIGVAAQAVGGARAALRAARDYASERETFGRPIRGHQAVAFMLAEMATEIEAGRQLYLNAAERHSQGLDCIAEASMAKLFASEMAERVATKAVQIHGGYGFLTECPAGKAYRDVRVYQIYEGTSEVQKILISRHLDELDL